MYGLSSGWELILAMIWLIIARAVQGIGAGSIMGLTQIVISDIVSLEERGKYSGFIGATVPAVINRADAIFVVGHRQCHGSNYRWCTRPTRLLAMVFLHQSSDRRFRYRCPHDFP